MTKSGQERGSGGPGRCGSLSLWWVYSHLDQRMRCSSLDSLLSSAAFHVSQTWLGARSSMGPQYTRSPQVLIKNSLPTGVGAILRAMTPERMRHRDAGEIHQGRVSDSQCVAPGNSEALVGKQQGQCETSICNSCLCPEESRTLELD